MKYIVFWKGNIFHGMCTVPGTCIHTYSTCSNYFIKTLKEYIDIAYVACVAQQCWMKLLWLGSYNCCTDDVRKYVTSFRLCKTYSSLTCA